MRGGEVGGPVSKDRWEKGGHQWGERGPAQGSARPRRRGRRWEAGIAMPGTSSTSTSGVCLGQVELPSSFLKHETGIISVNTELLKNQVS